MSGPRGLRCWGKYPGAFPRFSAFSPGRRGAGCARSLVRPGRSALPETVPRGEAIHISAPLSLGSARCLFRPIFLCCSLYHAPGLFPCLFILPLAGPASHPAYAPATTSPARYRAGRAKQYNHARNVKPFPPRRSPGRTLPGQEGVKGDTCLSPSPFSLPFGKKRKNPRPSMLRSLNEHRLLPLLSAPPTFLTSPRTCS